MRYRIHYFLLIILTAGIAMAAKRELTLSLADAGKLALANNLSLKQAHLEFEKSAARSREARSSAYPVVSGYAQQTRNLSIAAQPLRFPIPMGVLDPITGDPVPLPGDPSHQTTDLMFVDVNIPFGNDNNLVYGLSLTQPLFDGRVLAALRSAETYNDLAEDVFAARKLATMESVTVQYYRVLVAERMLGVMTTAVELSEHHLKDTKSLYAIGKTAELSVIRAEVAVADAKTRLSQAEKSVQLAGLSLKRTCGIDPARTIRLTESLEIEPLPIPDYPELAARLKVNQPILSQLRANQKLMKENILLKRAEFMPSLALTGSYQRQLPYNDGEFGSAETRKASSVGVSVSMPLFNGFGSKARLDQAKADFKGTQFSYQDTENALLTELSLLKLSLEESGRRIQAGQKLVEQAKKGLAMAEKLYQKGMATYLEYQDASNARDQAELNLAQAYLEYHTALAGIYRSVGTHDLTQDN